MVEQEHRATCNSLGVNRKIGLATRSNHVRAPAPWISLADRLLTATGQVRMAVGARTHQLLRSPSPMSLAQYTSLHPCPGRSFLSGSKRGCQSTLALAAAVSMKTSWQAYLGASLLLIGALHALLQLTGPRRLT